MAVLRRYLVEFLFAISKSCTQNWQCLTNGQDTSDELVGLTTASFDFDAALNPLGIPKLSVMP